jgi:hypothetical protein
VLGYLRCPACICAQYNLSGDGCRGGATEGAPAVTTAPNDSNDSNIDAASTTSATAATSAATAIATTATVATTADIAAKNATNANYEHSNVVAANTTSDTAAATAATAVAVTTATTATAATAATAATTAAARIGDGTDEAAATAAAGRSTSLGTVENSAAARHDKASKWVVITSIQYPTDDVKAMCAAAGKDPDLQMVVVADSKTPVDWRAEGCTYLSVEDQTNLDFKTAELLVGRCRLTQVDPACY